MQILLGCQPQLYTNE
ncbi:UNVERIFIED_CONTAM: hypothetical protein GTU68_056685 [Idotea baltica]|nr:hypothetical protein [Idotea baltica]